MVAKLKLLLADLADAQENQFDLKRDKLLARVNAGLVMATKNKYGEMLRETANEVLVEVEAWHHLHLDDPRLESVDDELANKRQTA